MSRNSVTRKWGDGEYCFRLGREEWRKIEKRFDVGPYEFLRRLSLGTWRTDYPREIIRLALQAGGSVTSEAGTIDDKRVNRLIEDYVDDRMFEAALFAADIITEMFMPPVTDAKMESAAPSDTTAAKAE